MNGFTSCRVSLIDPNFGRILAAMGNAGITDLDVSRVKLWLDEVLVAEIAVRIDLFRGEARAEVWTCDFSCDYVKINADYRS